METGRDSALANTATQTGNRHLHTPKNERSVADCSLAAETISNPIMSTTPPPSANTGASTTLNTNTSTGTQNYVSNAFDTTFGMPAGIKLDQFDRSDWATWSGILEAILTLHEAEDLLRFIDAPTNITKEQWGLLQRRTKVYLCLYVKQDVYSLIASNTNLPTFKDKWDKLRDTYGGASGSTTVFNLWRQLTQVQLDKLTLMAHQLAKINETHVALTNASMGITDNQFCLILLHALPDSYEVLASTILASGTPDKLKHSKIIARIINEEVRRSGSSLNSAKVAPIKFSSNKKKDHTNLTCHYCNKKGHIKPDCRKKKKDEKDKKEKENTLGNKAANTHVAIHSASIEEINNDLNVSLYAARKDTWMIIGRSPQSIKA